MHPRAQWPPKHTQQTQTPNLGNTYQDYWDDPNGYWARKQARKMRFHRDRMGWKMRDCISCNGSGYYDNTGSPPCGACGGTGKEYYHPHREARAGYQPYQVWEQRYGRDICLTSPGNPAIQHFQMGSGVTVHVATIWAESWEQAMTEYHKFRGLEPYQPMD